MKYVGRTANRLTAFELAKAKDFGNTSPNKMRTKKDVKAIMVATVILTCRSILIIRTLAVAK